MFTQLRKFFDSLFGHCNCNSKITSSCCNQKTQIIRCNSCNKKFRCPHCSVSKSYLEDG